MIKKMDEKERNPEMKHISKNKTIGLLLPLVGTISIINNNANSSALTPLEIQERLIKSDGFDTYTTNLETAIENATGKTKEVLQKHQELVTQFAKKADSDEAAFEITTLLLSDKRIANDDDIKEAIKASYKTEGIETAQQLLNYINSKHANKYPYKETLTADQLKLQFPAYLIPTGADKVEVKFNRTNNTPLATPPILQIQNLRIAQLEALLEEQKIKYTTNIVKEWQKSESTKTLNKTELISSYNAYIQKKLSEVTSIRDTILTDNGAFGIQLEDIKSNATVRDFLESGLTGIITDEAQNKLERDIDPDRKKTLDKLEQNIRDIFEITLTRAKDKLKGSEQATLETVYGNNAIEDLLTQMLNKHAASLEEIKSNTEQLNSANKDNNDLKAKIKEYDKKTKELNDQIKRAEEKDQLLIQSARATLKKYKINVPTKALNEPNKIITALAGSYKTLKQTMEESKDELDGKDITEYTDIIAKLQEENDQLRKNKLGSFNEIKTHDLSEVDKNNIRYMYDQLTGKKKDEVRAAYPWIEKYSSTHQIQKPTKPNDE